ncbi:hypothetical protein PISL3812_02775 [Talaromyces islandicus]|uniref:DUF676 domain-containing protein n=1 Tax=Talaromyces islandicus TaxID=28573 RepID=A0A0U1LQT6_TALIS|nr:hypothetical protein PISL3812_02775 [Talaromyces islandicus]
MGEGESRSDSSSHDNRRDPPEQPRSPDQGKQLHLTKSFASLESSSSKNGRSNSSQNAYAWWDEANKNYSSATSLGPSESPADGRRKLLLIYIHGFMGAETSFQKFPVHVHNLVAKGLAESHVVYSKVYPRYKSRRAMNIARDDFSEWLLPHESHDTDVLLLGHSLGGILSAEVALNESDPTNSSEIFKHNILGLINFDVPFLGLHPGIVGTGIASLFQPKRNNESPQGDSAELPGLAPVGSGDLGLENMSSWFKENPDSNYDPAFPNDVHRAKRSQLDGMLHFLKKNTGQVRSAMKDYATSYFEFGGCLTDYSGLRRRYSRLKELEAVDNMSLKRDRQGRLLRRIRFVNYYTASPGYPKKSQSVDTPGSIDGESSESREIAQQDSGFAIDIPEPSSPVLVDEDSEDGNDLNNIDPKPIDEHEAIENATLSNKGDDNSLVQPATDNKFASLLDLLPPLPAIPDTPSAIDPSKFEDKDLLKHAQKEYIRLLKFHEQAKKECEKTIKERKKLLEQLKKKHAKLNPSPSLSEVLESADAENITSPTAKEEEPDNVSRIERPDMLPKAQATTTDSKRCSSGKRSKDRKFCVLPKIGDTPDPLWVRLFIPDVDEVVAHQSIFLPNGLYYEWLEALENDEADVSPSKGTY